jgi:ABC-type lipoprotein export system ATPase subunit
LFALIRDLCDHKKVTAIVVSHDRAVERYAHDFLEMEDGRIGS